MTHRPMTRPLALLVTTLAALLLAAACAGGGPEEREFALEIQERALTMDPAVIRVKQGDTVTLRISTDEAAVFHLHGYDLEQPVAPGEEAIIRLTADATGRFNIALHGFEEHEEEDHEEGDEEEHEEDETIIGSLEVQPR